MITSKRIVYSKSPKLAQWMEGITSKSLRLYAQSARFKVVIEFHLDFCGPPPASLQSKKLAV